MIVTGARTNKVPTAPYRGRRAAGGDVPDRDHDRCRRAAAGGRRARAAPAQPRALVPLQDRARLDVRLGRLRALPRHRAAAAGAAGEDVAVRSRCALRPQSLAGARLDRRSRRAGTPCAGLVGVGAAAEGAARGARRRRCGAVRGALGRAVRARDGARARGTGSSSRSARRPTGQGHHTLFAQIAADPARASIAARVTVRTGDTDAIADGVGSFASRRRSWAARRSPPRRTTCWRAGRATRRSAPTRSSPPAPTWRWSRSSRSTGHVRVRRLIAVDDAGRIVNPLLAEGQVIGGAVQGLGAVLSEEQSSTTRTAGR